MTTTTQPEVTGVPKGGAAVTIDAAALWGLLSDLMVSAGGQETQLPTVLNGVLLHTATDPDGTPMLVGTSTDRFMLGQAHEPIGSGSLPPTFVRLPAVRALQAVLAPPDDPDDEDSEPATAVLSVGQGTVTLACAGQSVRVAATVGDWYPATFMPGVLTDAEPANAPAYVAGSYLGVLAAIAGRRGGRVVLTVQRPDRPVHAHIGDRYRAVVMPIKQDHAPPTPPAFLPIQSINRPPPKRTTPRKETYVMTTTQPATDQDRAAEIAAGLRHLAALVTEHPHLATDLRYSFDRWLVSVGHGDADARAQMLAFARAGRASGATVTEHDDGHKYAGLDVAFGPAVSLHVYADVEKVHGVLRRCVEQAEDGVTRRIVEYAPRPILAELDTPTAGESSSAA